MAALIDSSGSGRHSQTNNETKTWASLNQVLNETNPELEVNLYYDTLAANILECIRRAALDKGMVPDCAGPTDKKKARPTRRRASTGCTNLLKQQKG